MQTTFIIIHVITAILLTITILSQEKSTGMGSAVAGGGGSGFQVTQRGAARVLHVSSIVFCIIYTVSALAYILA